MAAPQEFDIQRAFTIWFKGERWAAGLLKGQWKAHPHQLPGVVAWHTPNGGKREAFEAKRLVQSGVEAGIHDYLFLWGGLYGLEFKQPDSKRIPLHRRSESRIKFRAQLISGGHVPEHLADVLSDSQLDTHPRLLDAGMVKSAVVDNLADAKRIVTEWGLVRQR